MVTIDSNWVPQRAVHPLEILKDEIQARGIKQADFAKSLGMQPSNFSRMLKNKEEVTPTFALKLEEILGIPAKDWTGFQEQYIRDLKRIEEANAEDLEATAKWQALDECFNVLELCRGLGIKAYLRVSQQLKVLKECISTLYESPQSLSLTGAGCFKRSTKLGLDERNLNTWVVLAQVQAKSKRSVTPYNPELIDKCASELSSIAHKQEATLEAVIDLLDCYGITLVYQSSLGKTPVDGYSAWVGDRPMIAVTLRHKDMDRFAFDVLHELGHIKLHLQDCNKRVGYVSIKDYNSTNKEEHEANRFAERALISDSQWMKICKQSVRNISPHLIGREIAERAESLGLSPSIALWRYKKEAQVYNIKGYTSPKLIF